jgi:hypothetical protein
MNRNKRKRAYGYIYSENYYRPIVYAIIEKNKKNIGSIRLKCYKI